jgi:glutaredoxin-like YruB-family protein
LKKIKVYSTPTCPYCKIVKNFFNEQNISFENIDVSTDQKGSEEMIKISNQMGVPVIDIEGKIIIGADLNQIKKTLGL